MQRNLKLILFCLVTAAPLRAETLADLKLRPPSWCEQRVNPRDGLWLEHHVLTEGAPLGRWGEWRLGRILNRKTNRHPLATLYASLLDLPKGSQAFQAWLSLNLNRSETRKELGSDRQGWVRLYTSAGSFAEAARAQEIVIWQVGQKNSNPSSRELHDTFIVLWGTHLERFMVTSGYLQDPLEIEDMTFRAGIAKLVLTVHETERSGAPFVEIKLRTPEATLTTTSLDPTQLQTLSRRLASQIWRSLHPPGYSGWGS